MIYQFPLIMNIDDVLPHIEDSDEFSVTEKDGYTVINYNLIKEDTFPDVFVPIGRDERGVLHGRIDHQAAIRRECRGIIFDTKTGQILRRPFHKFFNYRERAETQAISLEVPHHIYEKLDGSMIAPFIVGKKTIWGTKMGDTDVAKPVYDHINRFYDTFAQHCIKTLNCTPIFEWCSRKQRIVLDYPEDRLVLTALRHMQTGIYYTREDMLKEAKNFHIPVVDEIEATTQDIRKIEFYLSRAEGLEGFVIQFPNGHMIKIKSSWYLHLHKAKELIGRDKNIVALILAEQLDDLKPHMLDDDKKRIEDFEYSIKEKITELAKVSSDLVSTVRSNDMSRKDFATQVAPQLHSLTRALCFKLWDNPSFENAVDNVKDTVTRNINKNASYEEVRDVWFSGLKYND